MTDLVLQPLIVGDTWLQPFQWLDNDAVGFDIEETAQRVTIRRRLGDAASLALLTSYPNGGLTIDPDQVLNPGLLLATLEPWQTELFPSGSCVWGDLEMTRKGQIVSVAGTAAVVSGSSVIDVGTSNAELLKPGYLIEVDGVLLAVLTVDEVIGLVTTDYVWPATDATATLSAWRGIRQTGRWKMDVLQTTTED